MDIGESWTLTYAAAGTATGPYPGTFTMNGTLTATTMGADPLSGGVEGVVVTWSGQFSIDSPAGTVTGTHALSSDVASPTDCNGFPQTWPVATADGQLTYQATIRPASGGIYTDSGSTRSIVQKRDECSLVNPDCTSTTGAGAEFVHATFSGSTGVTQVVPTKAQCSKGGYADYGYATEKACKDASKPPRGPRQ